MFLFSKVYPNSTSSSESTDKTQRSDDPIDHFGVLFHIVLFQSVVIHVYFHTSWTMDFRVILDSHQKCYYQKHQTAFLLVEYLKLPGFTNEVRNPTGYERGMIPWKLLPQRFRFTDAVRNLTTQVVVGYIEITCMTKLLRSGSYHLILGDIIAWEKLYRLFKPGNAILTPLSPNHALEKWVEVAI
ncbi:LOW QUALITY PROTEIN: hypothetical protein Cgig2_014261 [Carnegiea gigantea]|uniref:Uncharacterized protein n=1 Tax=Carnegiea gigantea TaxID=171969 RepID=A0A9Q1K2N8_9CARY|nr:LOW QUALITY PROTEIN: hypothetical protein Cgig2_014261 [Carnegiea gigantea]